MYVIHKCCDIINHLVNNLPWQVPNAYDRQCVNYTYRTFPYVEDTLFDIPYMLSCGSIIDVYETHDILFLNFFEYHMHHNRTYSKSSSSV